MQRQLDKLVSSIGSVDSNPASAFTKAPKKIDDVTTSLGAARFQTANLAAQFQDIAVQLQGGQSPFTVALQQGTQISQVLGQTGATWAVSLLGSAFQSLLSPTSLATIAVIALGGAAVQYGLKAIGAVDDLDDNLKAHTSRLSVSKIANTLTHGGSCNSRAIINGTAKGGRLFRMSAVSGDSIFNSHDCPRHS